MTLTALPPDRPGMWIRIPVTPAQRRAMTWASVKLEHATLPPIDWPMVQAGRTRVYLRVSEAENYASVLEDQAAHFEEAARAQARTHLRANRMQFHMFEKTYDTLARKIRRTLTRMKHRTLK